MISTQIQLTEDQSYTLKMMSQEKNISISELVRQSINQFIRTVNKTAPEDKHARILAVAGKYESDTTDLSSNHDAYLTETYGVVGE